MLKYGSKAILICNIVQWLLVAMDVVLLIVAPAPVIAVSLVLCLGFALWGLKTFLDDAHREREHRAYMQRTYGVTVR